MITKVASAILPVMGGALGAANAAVLTDKQKELLRKYYGQGYDSQVVLRSAGRGALGAAAGAVPGMALMRNSRTPSTMLLGALASGAGSALGAKFMSKKYSPENAERVAGIMGVKLSPAERGVTDAQADARLLGITGRERAALIREHGLSDDADVSLRHAGRVTAGAYGGGALGAAVGFPVAKNLRVTNPGLAAAAILAPMLAGSIGGGYAMSRKYSKAKAQEILNRK